MNKNIMITEELGLAPLWFSTCTRIYHIYMFNVTWFDQKNFVLSNKKCEMRDKLYCDSEWGLSLWGNLNYIPLQEKL